MLISFKQDRKNFFRPLARRNPFCRTCFACRTHEILTLVSRFVDQPVRTRTGTTGQTQRANFIQGVIHAFCTSTHTLLRMRDTADQLQQSYQHPPFFKKKLLLFFRP